jgi:hypothetical protein
METDTVVTTPCAQWAAWACTTSSNPDGCGATCGSTSVLCNNDEPKCGYYNGSLTTYCVLPAGLRGCAGCQYAVTNCRN